MQVVDQVIQTLREIAQTEVMPRFCVWVPPANRTAPCSPRLIWPLNKRWRVACRTSCLPGAGRRDDPEEQHALWEANPDGLWVVDPIDGTTNFIHGLPYFAISVALMRHGRSELG